MNVEHFKDSDRHPDTLAFADYYKDLVGMHYYDSIVVFDKGTKIKPTLLTSTPI